MSCGIYNIICCTRSVVFVKKNKETKDISHEPFCGWAKFIFTRTYHQVLI